MVPERLGSIAAQLAKYMGPIWVAAVSKWAGHVGPTWAAQITPTVYVWCPFRPCGTQSSFAPWLPSGTHLGHVVQVGFWYMGPIWAAPDLPHVGFWYMGTMWTAPDLLNCQLAVEISIKCPHIFSFHTNSSVHT